MRQGVEKDVSFKVLTVVGARPQFVKAAAVGRVFRQRGVTEVLVHTGQHFSADMSDVFFRELGMPEPDYNLGVGGLPHGAMTGRMLEGIEGILERERPDWVLVYGDTNSTLAGALAAAKRHVPIAHVEAGLRSFNRAMPEEINRVLTDHVSTLLLCPTRRAVANLAREGIVAGCEHVGDVMYDVALAVRDVALKTSAILDRLGLEDDGFVLATVHRAENTEDAGRLTEVFDAVRRLADGRPVVLPLHPRTAQAAARHGVPLDGLTLCDPVGYIDMTRLICGSRLVVTDSGGLQKEAYFHARPCVTLRDETEWVETIECGWNRLWTQADYHPRQPIPDYGDGHAAVRITDLLLGVAGASAG